ncbi:energy-coupling factor transporter transmembrane component T [Stomatohabitans albus]|uniref:energy-coupling factor transporter transmembrane component T n=1 Tax=Stomatohabitans albus TaxID=3110766 RepID=UPI00300D98A4
MITPTQTGWCQLDPRTKLVALLVVNVLAFGRGSLLAPAMAYVFVCILLTNAMRWQTWIGYVVIIPLCGFLGIAAPSIWGHWAVVLIGMVCYWTWRFGISIGMAYYVVRTTKVSAFIAALRSWRVPQVVIVPVTVMLRFIPTVLRELHAIVDAMRLRGVIGSGWQMVVHPIQTAEYVVVPLLATTTRISDDLTASGMLRGLGRPGERTSVTPVGMGLSDVIALCGVVGLALLHMLNIPLVF